MDNNKKINVLLYGYGTISNSIIRAFNKSELVGNIFVVANQKSSFEKSVCIGNINDIKLKDHKKFIHDNNIDFVLIDTETLLLKGIIDFYKKEVQIPAVGTVQKWFLLEASKLKCKNFMLENEIKTPEFVKVEDKNSLNGIKEKFGLPLVIKSNRLEAGFGTFICHTKSECVKRVNQILKYCSFCIAEKFEKGFEISVHYAWDGNVLVPFIPVKDFKPFNNSDKVINTGGMGSFTPVGLNDKQKAMLDDYNKKLEKIFTQVKPDFAGIFVLNLLFTDSELYTLEFNMRPGITEFETLIELFDFDLLKFYYDLANHQLDRNSIKYKENLNAGCITVVDKEFVKQNNKMFKFPLKKLMPDTENKVVINPNFNDADEKGNLTLYKQYKFYTVLNTSEGNPFDEIYEYLKKVKCPSLYYRKDIGKIFSK